MWDECGMTVRRGGSEKQHPEALQVAPGWRSERYGGVQSQTDRHVPERKI